MSFRGRLIRHWQESGEPSWTLDESVSVARLVYSRLPYAEKQNAAKLGERLKDDYYCAQ